MAVAGAVWLPVLPDLSKFTKQVRAGATANLAGTGKAAGASYARGMTGAVRAGGIAQTMNRETSAGAAAGAKAVQDATGKVVKARTTAANAAGAVRTAEARLSDLRAKGTASSGQVVAAEERLAKAQRTAASASNAARTAQANLVKIGTATQNAFNDTGTAASTAAARTSRFGAASARVAGAARNIGSRVASTVPAVGNFATGMRDSTAAASAFTGRMGTLGGAVSRAMTPVGNFISGMRDSGAAASAFTGRAGTMGGAVAGVGARMGSFASRTGTALAAAGGAVGRFGAAVRSRMQGPMAQTLGFMGKFAGLAGLAGVAKSAFSASMGIDKTTRVLTGLYHSGSQAQDMMGRIKKLSQTTPIDSTAYETAAQNLAYMGVKGNDAIGIMRNLGAASIVAGKGSEGLNQASNALLKMVNTGKVYSAQLNQISEAGVPIFSGLAAKFHTNIANVREMATAGKIGVNDVLSVVQHGTGKTYQQTIAAAGQVSKSVDAQWTMAMNKMRESAGTALLPIVRWVANSLLPAFSRLIDFVTRNSAWIKPLAIGFGVVAGAIAAVTAATWAWGVAAAAVKSVAAAFKAVQLAILAVRVAMAGNPLGLILIAVTALAAGIVWLATKTRFFQTIWNGLKVAFAAVGQAFMWLYNAVFVPIGQAMATVFGWLWTTILHPIFSAIAAVFRTVGRVFAWLYTNIISPYVKVWMAIFRALYTIVVVAVIAPIILTIRALGAVFSWLWRNAIRPAITAIGAAARWLWNNAIGPAFRAIGAVAKWLWNNAIRPAFGAAKSIFRGLGSAASWLWRNAIGPAFRGIGKVANWVWDNVLHPVFSTFGKVIRTVGKAFKSFGKIVTGIWGGIKKAVKGGVQMVIDIVWNNSLRKVAQLANKIPGVGALIPDKWVEKPIKLARGGVIPGYAPGNDRVPAELSPGEAVLVPGAVRALGPELIDKLNAMFRPGGPGATGQVGVAGFARGGVVAGGKGGQTGAGSGANPDASASTDGSSVPDPALLAAATAATQALNAASTALNLTLVQLTATVLAYQTRLTAATTVTTMYQARLVALGAVTNQYRARLVALIQLGLVRLVTYIRAAVLPTLAALGQRYLLLGNQTAQLQARSTGQWNLLAARVVAAENRIMARQQAAQSFLAASWNYIASVVGSSVSRQNGAFGALNNGMGRVRNAMKYTADWADWAYGRMREAAAKPVRWVMNYPFNRGIIAAWNKLNKEFNFKKHVTGIAPGFATGGTVHGPGTATSDSVPIRASRGEFVVREKIASRALPFLHALNAGNTEALQATGGPHARLAKGGVVADTGSAADAAAARGLKVAKRLNGKPYIFGGLSPRGADCCIIGDVRIYGTFGAKRISEIKPGDEVYSYDDGKVTANRVTAAWQSITQPVFKVRTRRRSVTASANHPFLRLVQQTEHQVLHEDAGWPGVPARRLANGGRVGAVCTVSTCSLPVKATGLCNRHYSQWYRHGDPRLRGTSRTTYDVEWARLDELAHGDLLVQARDLATESMYDPQLSDNTYVDESMAWLIGAMVGDGTVYDRRVALCLFGDKRDRATAIITATWGGTVEHNDKAGLRLSNKQMATALADLGLTNRGEHKRIPAAVWNWPQAQQRAFLNGYCDADGHYPANQSRHGERTYHSASRDLIEDARALHMILGDAVGNISTTERTKPIVINNKPVKRALPLHNFTVWPGRKNHEAKLRANGGHGLSEWLDAGEFTVVPILEISDEGVQDTYDLTVEDAHNFIADGIVVHNSGIVAGVQNALQGKSNVWKRLYSTHAFQGANAPSPWKTGLKSAYGIGVMHRGGSAPGHMAGTLGYKGRGYNIESAQTPIVFPGKHGARSGQFTSHYYLPTIGGQFVGGGGGDIDPRQMVADAFKPVGTMLAKGKKLWAGNTMGYESLGVADRANKATQRAAVKKLETSMVAASGSSAGSPEVKAAVRAVAAKYGWGSGAQWNALSWIIGKESGWNPNAANPTSSARGLFQKMTSIHGALEPTVAGQAKWGMKYLKGRYGSPLAAQRFWRAHGHYDQGGMLPPGVSTVVNNTGHPEPVLTRRQFSALTERGETAPQVRVFIGDEEITDRIDTRIAADHAQTARALRAGRR